MSAADLESTDQTHLAFISYSRSDVAAAAKLQKRLEWYSLPNTLREQGGVQLDRRPLKPIFRDQDDLVPGNDLPARISAALASSKFLIVLCTPNAARSIWVEREIQEFRRLRSNDQILAVVLSGEPNAAQSGHPPEDECLPKSLRMQPATTEGSPNELLWIDARPSARDERRSFLRIVAALLELASLDTLIRRDQRRRTQSRLAWIATALLMLLTVGGFALNSRLANLNAEKAALDAQKAALDAQKARVDADRARLAEREAQLAREKALQNTVSAQTVRFEKWMHDGYVEFCRDNRCNLPVNQLLSYRIALTQDVNDDGRLDFLAIDSSFGMSGSGGPSHTVYISLPNGDFDGTTDEEMFNEVDEYFSVNRNNKNYIVGRISGNDFIFPFYLLYRWDKAFNGLRYVAGVHCGASQRDACFASENAMNDFLPPEQELHCDSETAVRYIAPFEDPAKAKWYEAVDDWSPDVLGVRSDKKWVALIDFKKNGVFFMNMADCRAVT